MINDFILEGAPLEVPNARKIIPFIQERIDWFHNNKKTVIDVCDCHSPDDREFWEYPPHAMGETEGANIVKELSHYSYDRNYYKVTKRSFSGFFETDLDEMLQADEIQTVYIVGVLTSICIFATAVDAKMRGYRVRIYERGVADIYDSYMVLSQLRDSFKIEII